MSAVEPARRRDTVRLEVALGYASQVTSAALLLAQHFVLPMLVGIADYGRMAFVTGAASLLFCAFDHGYNLLAVRKPRIAHRYLAAKLFWLGLALGLAWLATLGSARFALPMQLTVVAHALAFCLYTYYVHLDIATGRLRRVLWYSIVQGTALIAVPLGFWSVGQDLSYAPAAATVLALLVVLATRGRATGRHDLRRALTMPLRWRVLRLTSIKQAQISMGTIVDGVIIWAGVVWISGSRGDSAAGEFRIVMSALGLLAQAMPMPKQVLLRLARQVSDPSWMWRYALLLIGVGVLQAVLAAWLGPPVLRWVFPQAAESLHKAIMLLVAVPALRALYELQTIAHDRTQALEQLMRRTAVAALVLAGVAVAIGYLEGILAFYLVLVALCAAAILRPRQPRRPSSPTRRLS